MKRMVMVTFGLLLMLGVSKAQDSRIGVRFIPLNSSYMVDQVANYAPNETMNDKTTDRFDSLAIGIFYEKYFKSKSFLIKVDINYADMTVAQTSKQSQINMSYTSSDEYSQVQKQKFINVNLGLGSRVSWNRFDFSFGTFIPLTILPKGTLTREIDSYDTGFSTSSRHTECSGTFKPALGVGIGAFAGVSTVILKHVSLGIDFTYQINYLARDFTWHGETWYYQPTAYMTYSDEKHSFRNFSTSRFVPSISVAYAFGY